jgi:hypothetical protein
MTRRKQTFPTRHAKKVHSSRLLFGLINAGNYRRDYRRATGHNSQVGMKNRYDLKGGKEAQTQQQREVLQTTI